MTALASSWLMHLLHALWQSTAAALVVLALLRLLRDASPRLRHAIVLVGIIKFALPPMLPLPTGLFSAAPPVPELTAIRNVIWNADLRVVSVLMLLHLAGFAVVLTRLLHEAWTLQRVERRPLSPGIFVSDDIHVPMTFGIFRPVILLPASLAAALTPDELEAVIAHERQHIRRGDVALNWLQALLGALWWFHPLYRLLDRRARALREESCDDALIADGRDAAHYARTLLAAASFVSQRAPLTAAGIAETPHSLLLRVRRLADARFVPSRRLGLRALALIVAAALVLLPGLRVSGTNRVAFDHATRHALFHH